MTNIVEASFVTEMRNITSNMYRLGWDERNGGNISYILEESEVSKYLDLNKVIRTMPIGFNADSLIGKIFIVTGSGKYFKNVYVPPWPQGEEVPKARKGLFWIPMPPPVNQDWYVIIRMELSWVLWRCWQRPEG